MLIIPQVGSSGGTKTFLERLLWINKRNNVDSFLLLQDKEEEGLYSWIDEALCRKQLIPDRRGDEVYSMKGVMYELRSYWKYIREIDPDLIFVSNGTPWVDLSVFWLRIPVIYFMHTSPYALTRSIYSIIYKLTASYLSSRRKQFVTVSDYASDRICREMGVPRKYVKKIYNSFDETILENYPSIPSFKSNVTIFTAGHVVEYKNPELWVKVAAYVLEQYKGEVHFLWAGEGPLLNELKNKVKKSCYAGAIEFCGLVDDIHPLYRKALIYFQPSRLESHGISIVEAMAHGLPVVASSAGGIPESVVDGKTGILIKEHNHELYGEALLTLLNNRNRIEQMGTQGRNRAVDFFGSKRNEERILELYQ